MWMGDSKCWHVYCAKWGYDKMYACKMRVLLMASPPIQHLILPPNLAIHLLSLCLAIEMQAYISNQNHLAHRMT